MFDLQNYDEKECKNLNPQVLAFVGDGVYSLYIRHRIVISENIKGKELHSQEWFYRKIITSINGRRIGCL